MKKRSSNIRVSSLFDDFLNDVKKEVPQRVKKTDLTDDLVITLRQSGLDNQIKRLMKRRYL